jgi:heme-degrading monooxygenase HmoA
MNDQAFTLAKYRVKEGREEDFINSWNGLAEIFSSLTNPPLWGTLIWHQTDRTLFYSFGPWQSMEDVKAMRANDKAQDAFRRLNELCVELIPGDFEVITHVDVQR